MTAEFLPPVFDGHNDTVLSMLNTGRSFFERGTPELDKHSGGSGGHLDLPRAREGNFAGGFFAVYVPNDPSAEGMMSLAYAQHFALSALGTLMKTAEQSEGQVRVVTTAAEIEQCIDDGVLAMELHLEGAEPLDADGRALEVFHAAGVRSLGITHSRDNIFGHGVNQPFPHSPDTGPGLTEAGKELVRQCNALGVVIDLSHLNEKGFWDVAALSEHPLVATHSNVHSLTPHPRNLTDEQLDAIRESNGVVGLNFAVSFLREDGGRDSNTPLATMVRHIEYLTDTVGIDRLALGSDYDGTIVPRDIADAAGTPKLLRALKERGYTDEQLEKIAWRNWVRVLRTTWGS
jgi:membrane dipeptidase